MRFNKLSIVMASLLIIFVLMLVIHVAQNKLFWADEGYDICTLSKTPISSLIVGHSVQPNNNPLYSILQKTVISLSNPSSDSILIYYRLVSIISACLIVLFLYYFAQRKFGIFAALLCTLTLINQDIFLQYAAESRHYMLWLLCFTWLVIATTSVCSQRYHEVSLRKKIMFFSACLFNTLVISMGAIQVFAAGCACLLCWIFIYQNKDKASALKFVSLVVVLCLSIEYYYASRNLSIYSSYHGSNWDFIANFQKGDISLLKMPVRLLLPKLLRDGYLGILLANLFVLVGICVPFLYWRKRKQLTQAEGVTLVLSVSILFQILATIIIAGIIIYTRFYFVQRVFLYLIICNCFLTLVGGFVVFQFLSQKFLSQRHLLILKTGLVIVLIVLTFIWQAASFKQRSLKSAEKVNCEFVNNRLGEDLQTMLNTDNVSCERLNIIVKVSQRINQCDWFSKNDLSNRSLWKDKNNVWYLTESMAPNAQPFSPFDDCK